MLIVPQNGPPQHTSWCLTSALMPPKHALRGGNQSDDSFATSRSTFVASIRRCLFPAESQRGCKYDNSHASYVGVV